MTGRQFIPWLPEIHVHIHGRYWVVGTGLTAQEYRHLEDIRRLHGYRCVIIIDRWT